LEIGYLDFEIKNFVRAIMQFDILTIFPDLIYHYSNDSILGIAQKKNLIKIIAHNWREFAVGKHQPVDDTQYGGGAGMVLKVDPIYYCLESLGLARGGKKLKIENCKLKIIALDPAGKKFDQTMAKKFSKLDRLILISGRYQGFDERVYKFVDEKVSVGDYVLSGGELPALAVVEATSRLIPGVLGNQESLSNETFNDKFPISNVKSNPKSKFQKSEILYTRPDNFLGLKVPKVLLSGDHKKIAEWRKK